MIEKLIPPFGKSEETTEDVEPISQDKSYNKQYLETIREQQHIREKAVRKFREQETSYLISIAELRATVLRNSTEFEGDLLIIASNDFGLPLGVAPESVDTSMVFNHLKMELAQNKWKPERMDLRAVWNEIKGIEGVHTALPFLWDGNTVKYDIAPPAAKDYRFVTLRDATGLADWISMVGKDGVVTY